MSPFAVGSGPVGARPVGHVLLSCEVVRGAGRLVDARPCAFHGDHAPRLRGVRRAKGWPVTSAAVCHRRILAIPRDFTSSPVRESAPTPLVGRAGGKVDQHFERALFAVDEGLEGLLDLRQRKTVGEDGP